MVNSEREIEWNVCRYDTNFKCILLQKGKWKEEPMGVYNKWLFVIKQKGKKDAPTFGDQRNFFTGLLEVEWKNDNYVFKGGHSRNPQREIKVKMFQKILNEIAMRADVKDTPRGISYYLEQWDKNKDEYVNIH